MLLPTPYTRKIYGFESEGDSHDTEINHPHNKLKCESKSSIWIRNKYLGKQFKLHYGATVVPLQGWNHLNLVSIYSAESYASSAECGLMIP